MESTLKQHKESKKNTAKPNERSDFSDSTFWGAKITKSWFFEKFKTSPALTPYYSIEHQKMLYESFEKAEMNSKSESALLSDQKTSYLIIFLTNFWVYHLFYVLRDFRKPDSNQNHVFRCLGDPWTSWEWSLMNSRNFIFRPKFSQKGKPEVKILVQAFSEPESIDLSILTWNPH